MSTDPRLALYVSDLDGTLLRSDGSLSPYSVRTLNRLIGEGLRFTVASARGCGPIRSALAGLRLTLPVINQNGAFISDLASGRHLAIQALPPAIAHDLWSLLDAAGCRPFLMTFDGSFDRLYYNDAILRNDGMRRFLHDRQRVRDPRLAPLDHLADCRVVVFGDQVNDIDMFRMADEAYAVAGATRELAAHATAIIGANDDDAVARWLEQRWQSRANPLERTPG